MKLLKYPFNYYAALAVFELTKTLIAYHGSLWPFLFVQALQALTLVVFYHHRKDVQRLERLQSRFDQFARD